MAASLAEGETLLINAAREPEITDLAECLVAMGARIDGIGTDRLRILGVPRLHGATHSIIPDRIETGTYIMAVAATNGDVRLTGTRLAAAGETVINRVYHLDRGYERLEEKLAGCNARIERLRDGA